MIYRAKELGMSGLAITNHDNLSEVIAINREQKKLRKNKDDFVLAIGNEIFLVDNFDPAVKERQKYYHFILVAKDKIGYDALIELSTRAWYRSAVQWGRRRVPTLKADIEEVHDRGKCYRGQAGKCHCFTHLGRGKSVKYMKQEDYQYTLQKRKWI